MKRAVWIASSILLAWTLSATVSANIRVKAYKGYYYVPYDPTTMSFGLTPEEAKLRLLEWMNIPSLQLRLIGVTASTQDKLSGPTSWPVYVPYWDPGHELSYLFEDNFGKLYIVAIVPIHLWSYEDPDVRDIPEGGPSEWLPREQLRTIALQFLQQRVPNFLALPNEIEGYSFLATRVVYEGLILHRVAIVEVHKRLGVVISCLWRDPGEPVGLSTVPTLSQQQACQLALEFISQMPGVISVRVDESPPYCVALGVFTDEMGTTRLVWHVPVSAELDSGSPEISAGQGYFVFVDAHTGDVFLFDEMVSAAAGRKVGGRVERTGAKARREWRVMKIYFGEVNASKLLMPPPLQIDGTVYLWVGWLRSPLFGTSVSRVEYDTSRREARVTIKENQWRFAAGSKWLLSDRGRVALPRPVCNIHGRMYLPVSAVKHITGWRVEVTGDAVVLKKTRASR